MTDNTNSVLVVGFNTRPLAYSLNKAGYDVYAVDFFGDLDLYPYVEDYIIVLRELSVNYNLLKEKYSKFLAEYALVLHRKHRDLRYLLIGSGLDDAYEGRKLILDELKNFNTISVNNSIKTIKKSRNIESLFEFLTSHGYKVPIYCSFEKFQLTKNILRHPFILKKKRSAGGTNVFKIEDEINLNSITQTLKKQSFIPSEWLIQEYIDGISVSCTVISDGEECEIISINRQIIGEKFLNPPTEFMYCGNIVPAGLLSEEEKIISEISTILTKELGLKGIIGFDFVLRDHHPYFMECNPRIPGSIRASEIVLNLNLLDLHIKCFLSNEWKNVKKLIMSAKPRTFATKFILFAPNEIDKSLLTEINNLEFVHDKTEPVKNVLKGEPLCTILYEANDFSKSFNGAKQIIDRINRIIG
jgi:predicted ATP-grasp superfamily ATP-dependent carboligase